MKSFKKYLSDSVHLNLNSQCYFTETFVGDSRIETHCNAWVLIVIIQRVPTER